MFSLKVRCVFLVSALVLLLMLAHAPRACFAQEAGTNDDRALAVDRALGVLRNVVGLNVDAYNWSIRAYGKGSFWDVLPKEFVGFDFWTDGSQLEVYVYFVDGKVRSISIYPHKGFPLMVQRVQQAANEVEAAKGLLSRYQAYCGATHVEAFKAVLDTVEPKTNTVKVYGNVKFEAEYTKTVDVENRPLDIARFVWIYTFNGALSSFKWVAINFENGYFRFLTDIWNFFEIGSYDVRVDEKKAVEIAVNAAKNYSTRVYMGRDAGGNEMWVEVKDFKVVGAKAVSLIFGNGLFEGEARDGNPYKLYPVWTVEVYFDDVYAGGVYGVWLNIWADTGEVWRIFPLTGPLGSPPSDMVPIENGESEGQAGGEEQEPTTPDEDQEQDSTTPDDTSNSGTWLNLTQTALIAIPTTALIALTTVKVYSKRKRKPIKG